MEFNAGKTIKKLCTGGVHKEKHLDAFSKQNFVGCQITFFTAKRKNKIKKLA